MVAHLEARSTKVGLRAKGFGKAVEC
jgi:hypothetical protein